MVEPILVDCESGPHLPALYVRVAILKGAPTGWICRACGESCEVDEDALTKPHKRPDVIAMIERGDYG